MALYQVTSREFRENQASLFDLADEGNEVVIRRGKKTSYMLMPLSNTDFVLSPKAEKRLKHSRLQYLSGEGTLCLTAADAIKHLESL